MTKAGLKDPDELDELFKKACDPDDIPLKYREIAYEELCSNKAKLSAVPFKIDENVLKKIAGV